MGYMANVPLRFGDRRIQPGERVPVEEGRSYLSMIRLGQVTVVPDGSGAVAEAPAAVAPGGVELDWFTRKALNELAAKIGVEEPEKLPHKAAVITAVQELHGDNPNPDEE